MIDLIDLERKSRARAELHCQPNKSFKKMIKIYTHAHKLLYGNWAKKTKR